MLVDQGGHWLITHDTAMAELDAFWHAAHPCLHQVTATDELDQALRRDNAGGGVNRLARNGLRGLRRPRTRPLHRTRADRRSGGRDLGRANRPEQPRREKTNIVTPGFSPDEAGTIDDHLNRTNAFGYLPYDFVVTDIQPAPNNQAGATVVTTGGYRHRTGPAPVVLVDQGGHWLITHDTAMTELDALWQATQRPFRQVSDRR